MNNNTSSSSKSMVPGAKQALNTLKQETASELGITNYQNMDKGTLTSRQNGYVGGYMTKKLVQYAEEQMKNQMPQQ
jgi:hypothetical protein